MLMTSTSACGCVSVDGVGRAWSASALRRGGPPRRMQAQAGWGVFGKKGKAGSKAGEGGAVPTAVKAPSEDARPSAASTEVEGFRGFIDASTLGIAEAASAGAGAKQAPRAPRAPRAQWETPPMRSASELRDLPERISIRGRLDMLEERFPGVLHDNDFVARCEIALASKGFRGSNSIAITSLCRDEITTNLSRKLNEAFGTTFKLQGLGGLCSAGKTGLQAAFAHSPQDAFDGRERYVFFALTHIAIDSEGNVGAIRRPGRQGISCACGALQAALNDFKAAHAKAMDPDFRTKLLTSEDASTSSTCEQWGMCRPGVQDQFRDEVEKAVFYQFFPPGTHAPDDPEYTMLQNRLLRKIDIDKIQELDLVNITKAAEEVITEDLQDLITKVVNPAHNDYAIVTGIQIHAWDAHGRDQIDMVWPANIYCSQNEEISVVDVHDVSPPTSRQMKLLFGHLDKYSRANLTPDVTDVM